MRQPSTPQEVKPAGFDEIDAAGLVETEGGVAPMWDAQGNMIGCTDPRRWGFRLPGLSNSPVFGRPRLG